MLFLGPNFYFTYSKIALIRNLSIKKVVASTSRKNLNFPSFSLGFRLRNCRLKAFQSEVARPHPKIKTCIIRLNVFIRLYF